MKNNFLKRL